MGNGFYQQQYTGQPDSTTTYSVVIFSGCPDSLKTTVAVASASLIACCNDTIVMGDTTTIYASGNKSNSYS